MEGVRCGRQIRPRKTLLFGVRGVGKSSFAGQASKAIFIPTEEGVNDIDCDSFPVCATHGEVMQRIAQLYSEDHGYRTCVLDTADWLERLIWAEVCRKRNVENIEDIGYGKGYSFALNYWNELIAAFDALRTERNMAIIVLAHAKIEKFNDPTTDPYDRYTPALHKYAAAILEEWSDEVLFATYKVHTTKSDEGFNKKRTKGIGNGERILKTSERPSHIAKNRLCLPDEMPLDYSEYSKYLPQ